MKRSTRLTGGILGCWRRAAASIESSYKICVARLAGGVGGVNKLNFRFNERSSISSSRHTGQRSRCSSIATRVGSETQSSTYNESDCLVSSHNIEQLPIMDRMADRPRLLPFDKEQLRQVLGNPSRLE